MSTSISRSGRACLRRAQGTATQSRSFSSTVNRRKNGPLAAFPQTSSSELDTILNHLRENVFLPAHLRTPQQHLIYRKHFQHYLTGEEPVKVELSIAQPGKAVTTDAPKEEFLLKPLDKSRDVPQFRKTFNRICELIRGKPDDWFFLINFLRECKLAHYGIRQTHVEKLVRLAAEENKIGLLVECFKRLDTGIRICTNGIAQQMLYGAQEHALRSALAEQELDRAIRHITFVLRAIQDHKHIPPATPPAENPNRLPETFGHALAMHAARRWKWETENTNEKRAAKAAAAAAATEAVPEVEQPVAEAAAVENAEGETPAEAAAEEVAAIFGDAYALGERDIQYVEGYALLLLGNSDNAVLEFDDNSLGSCDNFLKQWLPAWYGIQMAGRIQAVNPDVKKRLKAAFDAEIDPAVRRAVVGLKKLQSGAKGERVLTRYEQYRQHLA